MRKNMNKTESISLKVFFSTSIFIAFVTLIYKLSPSWLPDVTLELAESYVQEKKGEIGFKLSLGLVLFLSGTLGLFYAERGIYKGTTVSKMLDKTLKALQASGGVFWGWGLGLLLYVLFTGKHEQIAFGVILLCYLTLFMFYPLLVAEQIVVLQNKTSNNLFPVKKDLIALKYSSLAVLCGGAVMFSGVLFWGW
jgi:hypothetical protein